MSLESLLTSAVGIYRHLLVDLHEDADADLIALFQNDPSDAAIAQSIASCITCPAAEELQFNRHLSFDLLQRLPVLCDRETQGSKLHSPFGQSRGLYAVITWREHPAGQFEWYLYYGSGRGVNGMARRGWAHTNPAYQDRNTGTGRTNLIYPKITQPGMKVKITALLDFGPSSLGINDPNSGVILLSEVMAIGLGETAANNPARHLLRQAGLLGTPNYRGLNVNTGLEQNSSRPNRAQNFPNQDGTSSRNMLQDYESDDQGEDLEAKSSRYESYVQQMFFSRVRNGRRLVAVRAAAPYPGKKKAIQDAKEDENAYNSMRTEPGCRLLATTGDGTIQTKVFKHKITVPREFVDKHKIDKGIIMTRLFVRAPGEIWSKTEDAQSFTIHWKDLEHRYRLLLTASHRLGEIPEWFFWYHPSQRGDRAKSSVLKLVQRLDAIVEGATPLGLTVPTDLGTLFHDDWLTLSPSSSATPPSTNTSSGSPSSGSTFPSNQNTSLEAHATQNTIGVTANTPTNNDHLDLLWCEGLSTSELQEGFEFLTYELEELNRSKNYQDRYDDPDGFRQRTLKILAKIQSLLAAGH